MSFGADPKQAIIEWLRQESHSLGDPDGTAQADLATVRFIKERAVPGHQCHAIAWTDISGRAWSYIVGVAQHSDGRWYVNGGGGGSGPRPHLGQSAPYAYLVGTWGGEHLYAGSWVDDPSDKVAYVRLVAGNLPFAEDTVDKGIVLFVGPPVPRAPLMVELYSREGKLLNRHEP